MVTAPHLPSLPRSVSSSVAESHAPMPPIETPCIRVCILDPRTEHCLGCGRSLDEIAGWIGFSDEQRADVIADLPRRLIGLQLRSPVQTGAVAE